MKKLGILLCAALLFASCGNLVSPDRNLQEKNGAGITAARAVAASPVVLHGKLAVKGNRIVDQAGTAVQFKGMSLFWSQWSPQFWNTGAVNELSQGWKSTIVRAAMGVESGGYLTNPQAEKARVKTIVDAAVSNGIYVIIDWHDHNAIRNKTASAAFFKEMAGTYKNCPNVLFEIFNEPEQESWGNIKAYAEEIIGVIRAEGAANIVIVGTPVWSQNVDQAADNPITKYSNVAYTLHYYAASHKQELRNKAQYALDKGVALMVTEFGTCEYTGNGFVDLAESQRWFDFLDANKISWMNWSLFDKDEAASALKPGSSVSGPWGDASLTVSGKFIKEAISGGSPGPFPPSIRIAAPAADAIVAPKSLVDISVSASDTDGSVVKVEFYAGSQKIGEDTSSPYGLSWTAPSAQGRVILKAIARDSDGLIAEHSISVLVQEGSNPLPVTFSYTKNDWGSGFTGNLKITNKTNQVISNWTLTFSFAGNQVLTNYWNGTFTQSGKNVTVRPTSWNNAIPVNGSIEVGFNAAYSGINTDPVNFMIK